MGIETGLLAGGALVGNYIKSKGEQRAAANAAKGIATATTEANQLRQPYIQAGEGALQGYQDLLTPEGQAQFAEQYTQGPMYQMLRKEAEDAALRNASATGGLRTGQTGVALSTIAPQLIQQQYQNQMQGYMPLINQGSSNANTAANTIYSGGIAATTPQMAADTAMSGVYGDAVSTLGGVGYDAVSSYKNAPTQVFKRPGQTYGR